METQRQFPALRSELESARQYVAQAAAHAGLDANAIQHCELVIDEVLTNIIEHGYKAQSSSRFIDVRCTSGDGCLTIIITDNGPAFDPLAYPTPDPDTPLEQRRGGGWGVHLIRTLMDEVSYLRAGQHNRLTLTKYAESR
jgi:anti-sigma regulatory factor (Ser/Thr protein kinase)